MLSLILALLVSPVMAVVPKPPPAQVDSRDAQSSLAARSCQLAVDSLYAKSLAVQASSVAAGNSIASGAAAGAAPGAEGAARALTTATGQGSTAAQMATAQYTSLGATCTQACEAAEKNAAGPAPSDPNAAAARKINLASIATNVKVCTAVSTEFATGSAAEGFSLSTAQMAAIGVGVAALGGVGALAASGGDSAKANPSSAASNTPTANTSLLTTSSATAGTAAPTTPLSDADCRSQMASGVQLLNSSRCLQSLQTSCIGNVVDSVCVNFTNYYCGTAAYDATLVSATGDIAAGSGRGSTYSDAATVQSTHALPTPNYCQKKAAISFCLAGANINCLSCRAMRGLNNVSSADVANAKLNCAGDPNYQPGLYDTLLGVLPATSTLAPSSVQSNKTNSIIGTNPL